MIAGCKLEICKMLMGLRAALSFAIIIDLSRVVIVSKAADHNFVLSCIGALRPNTTRIAFPWAILVVTWENWWQHDRVCKKNVDAVMHTKNCTCYDGDSASDQMVTILRYLFLIFDKMISSKFLPNFDHRECLQGYRTYGTKMHVSYWAPCVCVSVICDVWYVRNGMGDWIMENWRWTQVWK